MKLIADAIVLLSGCLLICFGSLSGRDTAAPIFLIGSLIGIYGLILFIRDRRSIPPQ